MDEIEIVKVTDDDGDSVTLDVDSGVAFVTVRCGITGREDVAGGFTAEQCDRLAAGFVRAAKLIRESDDAAMRGDLVNTRQTRGTPTRPTAETHEPWPVHVGGGA